MYIYMECVIPKELWKLTHISSMYYIHRPCYPLFLPAQAWVAMMWPPISRGLSLMQRNQAAKRVGPESISPTRTMAACFPPGKVAGCSGGGQRAALRATKFGTPNRQEMFMVPILSMANKALRRPRHGPGPATTSGCSWIQRQRSDLTTYNSINMWFHLFP